MISTGYISSCFEAIPITLHPFKLDFLAVVSRVMAQQEECSDRFRKKYRHLAASGAKKRYGTALSLYLRLLCHERTDVDPLRSKPF